MSSNADTRPHREGNQALLARFLQKKFNRRQSGVSRSSFLCTPGVGGQAVEVANDDVFAGHREMCQRFGIGNLSFVEMCLAFVANKTDYETTQNPVMVTVLSEMQEPLPVREIGKGSRG